MSISALDLNLLLVLHMVLSERSVARAAQRLHVTPSAVSNSLAKLRSALGDPLITRRGRGIVPTPRAQELAPTLARIVDELERALAARPFEAASCTRSFTLAMADAGQVAWVPRIARALSESMPHARLRVVGIDAMLSLGDLASSEVDLHVGVKASGRGIHTQPLLNERTILVCRKKHPAGTRKLSRPQLGALRHVGVEMAPGRGFRDPLVGVYARAGIERIVTMIAPSFMAAAGVAANTDLVTTLPASLFAARGESMGLRELTGAVPVHSVALAMCWHERTHRDPAMREFRATVRNTIVDGNGALAGR